MGEENRAGGVTSAASRKSTQDGDRWVGTWGASPQLTEPGNNPPSPGLGGNTLRQFVYVSIGGGQLRIQLSNRYGDGPVRFRSVRVAQAQEGASKIEPETDVPLTFSGSLSVTVAEGEAIYSDPFFFPLKEQSSIAVSIHFGAVPEGICGHPGSRTTSYIQSGDKVKAEELTGATTDHWYYLTRLEVMASSPSAALVIVGDSLTDGRGSTTNGNDRWPDVLSRRLRGNQGTEHVAVVNAGMGGNRVLEGGLGPTALQRFERDAVGQAGVRWVIVLEGVNDIGEAPEADVAEKLIGAYERMIDRAHEAGLLIYGAPILPFGGNENYDTPERQQARDVVNEWIRSSASFDAVLEFDVAVADPSNAARLQSSCDDGDALHLSAAGYRLMADSVDLKLFES